MTSGDTEAVSGPDLVLMESTLLVAHAAQGPPAHGLEGAQERLVCPTDTNGCVTGG